MARLDDALRKRLNGLNHVTIPLLVGNARDARTPSFTEQLPGVYISSRLITMSSQSPAPPPEVKVEEPIANEDNARAPPAPSATRLPKATLDIMDGITRRLSEFKNEAYVLAFSHVHASIV